MGVASWEVVRMYNRGDKAGRTERIPKKMMKRRQFLFAPGSSVRHPALL